jgi:hypothetical protein
MFDDWHENDDATGEGSSSVTTAPVRFDPLPESLANMAPGARLGDMLACIDRDRLCGEDRVVVMQAWSRQVAHAQAELYASMSAVAEAVYDLYPDEDPFAANDVASSEIRAALTLTRRSADYHLGFAQQLVADYPDLWTALHRGSVDLPKTRVIVDQTSHLEGAVATAATRTALERAHRQTTGQVRAFLQKLVIEADPAAAHRRYDEGVRRRRVTAEPTDTGTANLFGLDLPASASNSAMRRINRLARRLKTAGDARTMDQIRADVFLDLLNGHDGPSDAGDRGVIDIRVDLTTLAGLDESAAEIPGWGPVIADIARRAVEEQDDAEWRFTVTDPVNGQVIADGTTRRRPTSAQRRRVEARVQTCSFPGCRMPAGECDIDHTRAWADGGATDDSNLAPLCRRDHRLNHNGWSVEMVTPGVFVWTSPLGRSYVVQTEPP